MPPATFDDFRRLAELREEYNTYHTIYETCLRYMRELGYLLLKEMGPYTSKIKNHGKEEEE